MAKTRKDLERLGNTIKSIKNPPEGMGDYAPDGSKIANLGSLPEFEVVAEAPKKELKGMKYNPSQQRQKKMTGIEPQTEKERVDSLRRTEGFSLARMVSKGGKDTLSYEMIPRKEKVNDMTILDKSPISNNEYDKRMKIGKHAPKSDMKQSKKGTIKSDMKRSQKYSKALTAKDYPKPSGGYSGGPIFDQAR